MRWVGVQPDGPRPLLRQDRGGHARPCVRRDSKVAPAAWRNCWWQRGSTLLKSLRQRGSTLLKSLAAEEPQFFCVLDDRRQAPPVDCQAG